MYNTRDRKALQIHKSCTARWLDRGYQLMAETRSHEEQVDGQTKLDFTCICLHQSRSIPLTETGGKCDTQDEQDVDLSLCRCGRSSLPCPGGACAAALPRPCGQQQVQVARRGAPRRPPVVGSRGASLSCKQTQKQMRLRIIIIYRKEYA